MRSSQKHLKRSKRVRTRRNAKKRGGKLCESSNNVENIYTIDPNKKVGSTWYVYDLLGYKDIVIKQIGPPYYASDIPDIEQELQVAKQASYLGVGPKVLYITSCKTPDHKNPAFYLVMERVYGHTLEELRDKQKIPVIQYEAYLRDYEKLLDVLYNHGITVNDRASRNIMIGHTKSHPESRLWIIDFGVVEVQPNLVERNKRK